MGREPSQFRRPQRAIEPLVSRLEGVDVDPDLRIGRLPASNFAGNAICFPGGGVHSGELSTRASESGVSGDRVFPDRPGGCGPFRGSSGRDQPECARPCLLGRSCHHLVDEHPGEIQPQAVHPQQRHHLGRRSPDPGGQRTIRRRGVIPASLRIRPVGGQATALLPQLRASALPAASTRAGPALSTAGSWGAGMRDSPTSSAPGGHVRPSRASGAFRRRTPD